MAASIKNGKMKYSDLIATSSSMDSIRLEAITLVVTHTVIPKDNGPTVSIVQ